jgi:hypothetical protein
VVSGTFARVLRRENDGVRRNNTYEGNVKVKIQKSRYTPWRSLGGEEV